MREPGAVVELYLSWRRTLRIDPEGIQVVLKYFGNGFHCRWEEIAKVEVECYGEDKDDMDFCHHITLFTSEGKKIRANDHRARNFLEFVTALQQYLVIEDQRKQLDMIIGRYEGVSHNGAD